MATAGGPSSQGGCAAEALYDPGPAACAFRGRHLPLNVCPARGLAHHTECRQVPALAALRDGTQDRFEADAMVIGGPQLDRGLWVSLLLC